ncbi:MAG: hypothetical protein ACXWDO_02120 [Bacteroidia bacterium]
MSCDPKSFSNVNIDVFEALRSKLSSAGYDISGTEGTINGPMGIVIDFEWDEANATLHTQVVSKNFLVPCSRINSELAKAINEVSNIA